MQKYKMSFIVICDLPTFVQYWFSSCLLTLFLIYNSGPTHGLEVAHISDNSWQMYIVHCQSEETWDMSVACLPLD